jgi:hypothetical protein
MLLVRTVPNPSPLSNSMEQSPSWKASDNSLVNSSPHIFWNPKVRGHVNKSLLLVRVLGQSSPVYPLPSCFFKIHFNMSSFTLVFHVVCIPQDSPLKPTMHFSLPFHTIRPIHLIIIDLITWIIFCEEHKSWSSSLCSFLQSPFTSTPLGPNYLPQHPIQKHPQPLFFCDCESPRFISMWNNRQNCSSLYFNVYLVNKWEDRTLWTKW